MNTAFTMTESQSEVIPMEQGSQLETSQLTMGSVGQLTTSQPVSPQICNTQVLDACTQGKNSPAPETDVTISKSTLKEQTASEHPSVTDTGQKDPVTFSHDANPMPDTTDIKKTDLESGMEQQSADPEGIQEANSEAKDVVGSPGISSSCDGPDSVQDPVCNKPEQVNITINVPESLSSEQCLSVPELTVCDTGRAQAFIGPVIPMHSTPTVQHSKRKVDNGEGILMYEAAESLSPAVESDCKKPKFYCDNIDAKSNNTSLHKEILVEARSEITVEMDDMSRFENDFSRSPTFLSSTVTEFDKVTGNFLKGCKWSPDGTCLVTNSDDNQLRLFNLPQPLYTGKADNLPEMEAVLRMSESELVYDYCWLPGMSSYDPDTCAIVSTSRDTPVHMWDAFTGKLRCSYRSYDNADDLTATHSLAFSLDGSKMYCGFNKMIRVFDVSRPGRECVKRPTFVKQGQPGIISCIAMNPSDPHIYAAGSYSRTIALYGDQKGDMVCMFLGQQGGVTHIIFSPDGTKLYSGGRKDPEILCWDIRNPGDILFTTKRHVATNQRIYLDLDATGRYLMSGNHNGTVHVWDTLDPAMSDEGSSEPVVDPAMTFQAHDDTVNGISLHPTMPILATASGQRHFNQPGGSDSSESESDMESDGKTSEENSLKLWWVGK